MKRGFVSFRSEIEQLVHKIVPNKTLHGLWLNTLSYLENCGARKIAACQHPTAVKEEMLKHAAEEFRHAFYLKKQLARIGAIHPDYSLPSLIGGWPVYHYLNALDLSVSRFLSRQGLDPNAMRQLSYLLVTYAIELRAGELYPLYQLALKEYASKVQVQSILLEEEEHLSEMEKGLSNIENAEVYAQAACSFEALLFQKWVISCNDRIRPGL